MDSLAKEQMYNEVEGELQEALTSGLSSSQL